MTRLLLFVLARTAPAADREWVVGDTIEELDRRVEADGRVSATAWLLRETVRAVWMRVGGLPRRLEPSQPALSRDGSWRSWLRDISYSARLLRRSPGFAGIAIATLGLAAGANVAMFAVVHHLLLAPLPFADADRLMLVHLVAPDDENPAIRRETVWSFPKYESFMPAARVFDLAALYTETMMSLTGGGDPERVPVEVITEEYPALLGALPVAGRGFTQDEGRRSAGGRVALIGHGLWTRRFGADPNLVGRSIVLNATSYTVVGVLPAGFRGLGGRADLWVPLGAEFGDDLRFPQSHNFNLVARRSQGVTEAAALAAVRAAGARVDEIYSGASTGSRTRLDAGQGGAPHTPWSATARSLDDSRANPDVRRASWLLAAGVGVVLLIACVNLANLAGARALARRREVAVRLAMGAGRAQIVRQFTTDGLVLGICGAVTAVGVAWGLLRAAAVLLPRADVFLAASISPVTPRIPGAAGLTRIGAAAVDLDRPVLLFAVAATVLAAMIVSLLSALRVSSIRPQLALHGGRSSADAGPSARRVRSGLVTVQVMLSLMLLTAAGLLVRSAGRLLDTGLGVSVENVLTSQVALPAGRYTPQTGAALLSALLDRIRTMPGVRDVALGNCLPVSGGCNQTLLAIPPGSTNWQNGPLVGVYWADASYFSTLGIRVVAGRGFTAEDRAGRPKVAVVSEAAGRAIWPNGSPLGQRIGVGQGGFQDGAEIVGVVSDVRYSAIETAPIPDVYLPMAQSYRPAVRLFVRADGDVLRLAPLVGAELRALDPTLPLGRPSTLSAQVHDAMWRTRVGAWLVAAFAGAAVLLTAIGIFGVMAQTVAQRTPEIGVRVALGATRRDVLALVFRNAATVTGIGVVAGLVASIASGRAIASFLYETSPADPLTLVLTALVVAAVAFAASYWPARRALRVDAVVALRAE